MTTTADLRDLARRFEERDPRDPDGMQWRAVRSLALVLAVCGCGEGSGAGGSPVDGSVEGGSADGSADGGSAGDGSAGADPIRVAWTELDASGGPEARGRPAMATLGDRVVLFGGGGVRLDTFHDDTWVLEGGAWREVDTDPTPPARSEGMMVELDGRAVLFGGLGQTEDRSLTVHEDTWAFDGERWEELPVTRAPDTRGGGAAVVDGHIVLYGGLNPELERQEGTWVFDGQDWTERVQDPAPTPVRDTAMAGDGTAGYLTGGSAPAPLRGVWRWDGSVWSEVGAFDAGRAYHAAGMLDGHLIVFGGVRTSTDAIAETDAWPGPIEVVQPEPEASQSYTMVSRDHELLMWGDDPAQMWALRVAE